MLPATRNTTLPCPKGTLDKWFTRTVELADIDLPPRARWHALRRKFATELRHVALKDLCQLGGWKDPKTVLECYQHPDEEALRTSLANRTALGTDPTTVHSRVFNGQ